MNKFEVTLKSLRTAGACFEGYNKLVMALQGRPFTGDDAVRESYIRYAHKDTIDIRQILESNGLDDALWALRCVDAERELRLYAVWCARQVQHLMTDHRSVAALDVAERFANGLATAEELDAARDAARAAAWDAARDARAARDAAWAAGAAAWAAWDAARAAAWDAARDAAGAAARADIKDMLILMLSNKAPWQV